MKLFIDTANVDEIRAAARLGVICGVTTNPSLIAKEGRRFEEVIEQLEATRLEADRNREEAARLIAVTEQSFWEGMKFARFGYRVGDISHAIQKYVEDNGFPIVREYVGHGIGRQLHEEPEVPNFLAPNRAGRGPRLVAGMTIAIEPMVNVGTFEVKCLSDGWTVKTVDGSLSSHYENTVLITKDEPVILTADKDGKHC